MNPGIHFVFLLQVHGKDAIIDYDSDESACGGENSSTKGAPSTAPNNLNASNSTTVIPTNTSSLESNNNGLLGSSTAGGLTTSHLHGSTSAHLGVASTHLGSGHVPTSNLSHFSANSHLSLPPTSSPASASSPPVVANHTSSSSSSLDFKPQHLADWHSAYHMAANPMSMYNPHPHHHAAHHGAAARHHPQAQVSHGMHHHHHPGVMPHHVSAALPTPPSTGDSPIQSLSHHIGLLPSSASAYT